MKTLILALLSALLISACAAPAPDNPIMCTQEAKMCPDGSYVGRTGPRCEFAPCPQ